MSFQTPTDKGKSTVPTRSKSLPPILPSSLTVPSLSLSNKPPGSHSVIVDKVSFVLEEEDMEEDDSEDEEFIDDDNNDMSSDEDPDRGPHDSMTLVQYQTEVRREALIQKGSHISDTSSKKGRVMIGGPSS